MALQWLGLAALFALLVGFWIEADPDKYREPPEESGE